jgi:hypothetical protein
VRGPAHVEADLHAFHEVLNAPPVEKFDERDCEANFASAARSYQTRSPAVLNEPDRTAIERLREGERRRLERSAR